MNWKIFGIAMAVLLLATAGCIQPVEIPKTTESTGTVEEMPEGWGATETVNLSVKYLDVEGNFVTDEAGETLLDETIEVAKGTNAFEALKTNFDVMYDEFELGAFIKGFNGTEVKEGYYLAMYVNGEYAMKGISDYVLEEDISFEFKIEAVEDFGFE